VEHLYIATNHNYLLFFTDKGRCYWLKVYEIPEGGRASKGRAIQNLLQIEAGDKVRAYMAVPDLTNEEILKTHSIIMVTKKGTVKKTELEAYSRPRSTGIIAINIEEGDELLEAKMVKAGDHVIIAKRSGMAIRFPEEKVRNMGRNATGVKGVEMVDDTDEVIGMVVVDNESYDLLVVSDNGYGKRSKVDEYRLQNRGGKGVITLKVTEKTGSLVAIRQVTDQDDLMIITRNGISIRMKVADIRAAGRNTQGVRLIRLSDDDRIAAVTQVAERDEEEITPTENNSPAEEPQGPEAGAE
jgi:DNA gyrase subunit A